MTLKGLIAAEKISADQLFLRKSASGFYGCLCPRGHER